MLFFKEQNNLSGERLLACITDDVIKASEIIYDINEKDLNVVRHFMEQKELIYWLRENMQSNLISINFLKCFAIFCIIFLLYFFLCKIFRFFMYVEN